MRGMEREMGKQRILTAVDGHYEILDQYFDEIGSRKVLLVCDSSIGFLAINTYFLALASRKGIEVVRFDDFVPNPLYESVVKGVRILHETGCDSIAAVGGGSAMDVAKCIKLYSNMDDSINYLKQEIVANDIPFLAVPTTAGTGSEATRYAVIYYEGAKQSVTHESCIPATVLMDSSVLATLPAYQKKSTMMDALCHAIESFWSVNSTDESKVYSGEAIRAIMANMDRYLAGDEAAHAAMLRAANTAGRAINITQTTAGHAMCYKVTSLYGAAHGHAALLCDRVLFPWMLEHTDRCIDPRGEEYLKGVFDKIAEAMGCPSPAAAAARLEELRDALGLEVPEASEEDIEVLSTSVNPVRLKNHPVALDGETIRQLYRKILRVSE